MYLIQNIEHIFDAPLVLPLADPAVGFGEANLAKWPKPGYPQN